MSEIILCDKVFIFGRYRCGDRGEVMKLKEKFHEKEYFELPKILYSN